jgi:hypothetical protein
MPLNLQSIAETGFTPDRFGVFEALVGINYINAELNPGRRALFAQPVGEPRQTLRVSLLEARRFCQPPTPWPLPKLSTASLAV